MPRNVPHFTLLLPLPDYHSFDSSDSGKITIPCLVISPIVINQNHFLFLHHCFFVFIFNKRAGMAVAYTIEQKREN
jgi:hypothetical protein